MIRVSGTIEAEELTPEFRTGLLARVRGLEAGMKVVIALALAAAFLASAAAARPPLP